MSWWPFRKREAPKPPVRDLRNWNEDWKVGDTAECIVGGGTIEWDPDFPPWQRPDLGQRLTVSGFRKAICVGRDGRTRHYVLEFSDWPMAIPTIAFRKVRPVAAKQSEVVNRILTAKPGKDRKREDA